jgi:hypothetical protein
MKGKSGFYYGLIKVSYAAILVDWVYLFQPALAVYKLPLPELIKEVEQALKFVKNAAISTEEHWSRRDGGERRSNHPGRPSATVKPRKFSKPWQRPKHIKKTP